MLKLPIGIDDFKKIREKNFYYVDKTQLIEQLLENWGEVNLFTRPRRFGKTLNMSMLKAFFEIGADSSLFDGLYISNNKSLCEEHMGKYPVIFLSLKNVEGLTYEQALYKMKDLIGVEAERFSFLATSEFLTENEKKKYQMLISLDDNGYAMSENIAMQSLQTLSTLLYKHYKTKPIILIDEYDVPLDKAFQYGYYKEMVSLMRSFLGNALKTNDALQFAVLTGCLRISKESIFTGLNNFKVLSIIDTRFDEQFGFTNAEVQQLLSYYQLEDHYQEIKEWYDGYHFGNTEVYCPWDVINYVDTLVDNPKARPQAYWINTSGNHLVKRFIDKADASTKEEIEQLISGETVEKKIRLDLTYDEIDNSIENLWSVLFTTGYLTQTGVSEDGAYQLIIPNKEVREVYKQQIQEWFREKVLSNTEKLTTFWKAMEEGNAKVSEKYINTVLSNTISVFDKKTNDLEKENPYHTLLVGLLAGNAEWRVRSNIEGRDGFADIIVETEDPDAGIVIEVKYTKEMKDLEKVSEKALEQIKEKRYYEYLTNQRRDDILLYGIAFCNKRCCLCVEKL